MKSETSSFCHNETHGEDAHLSLAVPDGTLDLILDGVTMSEGKQASEHVKNGCSQTKPQTPSEASKLLRILSKELYKNAKGKALTTATIAITQGNKLTVLNVGDSPAWLLRASGRIRALTTLDKLPGDPAAITQAVGQATISIHKHQATIKPGDTLLLMTDGVSDNLSREEIARSIRQDKNAATIQKKLQERRATNTGQVFGDYKEDDASMIIRTFS